MDSEHTSTRALSAAVLSLVLASAAPRAAAAAERRLGFDQESSVQASGTAELQPSSSVNAGRELYYSRMNARLGVAFGLAKNLEGAFFWDLSAVTEDYQAPGAAAPVRVSTTDFRSASAHLKYELSDPVADALGCALLVEGSYGPYVVGAGGRLILDKQLGSLLLVGNVFGGDSGQLDRRSTFEGSLGASIGAGYFFTPSFVAGVEVRNETLFDSGIDSATLYAGPSLAFLAGKYWATLAAEPQIAALAGASPGHHLDLDASEHLQVRLLFGFSL